MEYATHRFSDLTTAQLYGILALRAQVFVVEQNAPYLDIDGMDEHALHICATANGALAGYARLFAPGVKFAESSVGRIVLHPDYRGGGHGRALIAYALQQIENHFGLAPVRIEAQVHLQPLYAPLGFVTDSAPYDWGGIDHVRMLRPSAK